MSERTREGAGDLPPGGWDQVFARSPSAVVLVVDGLVSRVNPAACELFGLPEDRFVGSSAIALADTAMGPEVRDRTATYLELNQPGAVHLEDRKSVV